MMFADDQEDEMMRAEPMWLEQRTRRLLEQHALGELRDEQQLKELERLLEAQGQTLAQAVEALKEDSARQLQRLTQPLGRPPLRAPGARGPRFSFRAAPALLTALAAVCLGVGMWMRQAPTPVAPEQDPLAGVRAKGAPLGLLIWRLKESGPEALRDGQQAQAGDTLQLQAHVPPGMFAAIYSVDGRGQVTQHWPYPEAKAQDTQMKQVEGALLTVARSYTLDDAPRFERFYLLVGDAPEPLEGIERWLKANAEPAAQAPDKLKLNIFTVRKP